MYCVWNPEMTRELSNNTKLKVKWMQSDFDIRPNKQLIGTEEEKDPSKETKKRQKISMKEIDDICYFHFS